MYIFATMSSTTSTCTQKGSEMNQIQNHSVFPEIFDTKKINSDKKKNFKTIYKCC